MDNHQDYMDAYAHELGHEPPSWGKEASGAKRIRQQGFSVQDMLDCYRYYKSTKFWSDKHLSLQYIASNIAAWRKANPPKTRYDDDALMQWYKKNGTTKPHTSV